MNIAPYIDHTQLRPDATIKQIEQLCQEAMEYGFATVCVNPCWVGYCTVLLAENPIKICTVVGFPSGANSLTIKTHEAMEAVYNGASEIDMVINIGALKSKLIALVENEIKVIRAMVPEAMLKVIIETCLLTDQEKKEACQLAKNCGADFVKTSTGFSTGGATVEDVALMKRVVGETMGVKASGGIKDLKTAIAMIEAGATRLGCSAGVAIIKEQV